MWRSPLAAPGAAPIPRSLGPRGASPTPRCRATPRRKLSGKTTLGRSGSQRSSAPAQRIERRSAIDLNNATAQAELGHLDDVVGLLEDLRLPALTPGMNLDQEFARLDHDRIEVVRRLTVPAQFQVNLC